MDQLAWLFELIRSGGWPAAVAAGVLAGLALAAILYARTVGLVSGSRTDFQVNAFQDRLLRAVEGLTASEETLRRRIDQLQGDKLSLQDEVAELRASLALMRRQRRRLIELMRDIKYARLGPAAIKAAGIELELQEGLVREAGPAGPGAPAAAAASGASA